MWESQDDASITLEDPSKYVEREDVGDQKDKDKNCAQVDEAQRVLQTHTTEVRRSNKISWPTKMYSPSIYYLFMIDDSKPKYYEQTIQVDDTKK